MIIYLILSLLFALYVLYKVKGDKNKPYFVEVILMSFFFPVFLYTESIKPDGYIRTDLSKFK